MTRGRKLGWPEVLTVRTKKSLVSSGGPTANETTHLLFAVDTADKVLIQEPILVGGTITVSAFTPSSTDPEEFGTFAIEIRKKRRRVSLTIMFPTGRSQRDIRQALDVSDWSSRGHDQNRNDIVAASWDEAWLIVCEIGQIMKARQIRLEYGGYES